MSCVSAVNLVQRPSRTEPEGAGAGRALEGAGV
jgi:hypothetical protein